MSGPKPLTDAQRAQVRTLHAQGLSPSWIARRLGIGNHAAVERYVGELLLEQSMVVPAHRSVLLPSSIPPPPLSRLMAGR